MMAGPQGKWLRRLTGADQQAAISGDRVASLPAPVAPSAPAAKGKWLGRLKADTDAGGAGDTSPAPAMPPRFPWQAHQPPQVPDDGLLASYRAAAERLRRHRPEGTQEADWRAAVAAADDFLARWAGAASAFGWPVHDIFAAPTGTGIGGLVWEVRDGRIAFLLAKQAIIEAPGRRSWFAIP